MVMASLAIASGVLYIPRNKYNAFSIPTVNELEEPIPLEAGKSAILQKKLGTKTNKMVYANAKDIHGTIKMVPVKAKDQLQFSINEEDIQSLAKQAVAIEKHYGKPMDIEWAKDGENGEVYILQARPETVKAHSKSQNVEHYSLLKKGKVLTTGESIGQRIVHGVVIIARSIL